MQDLMRYISHFIIWDLDQYVRLLRFSLFVLLGFESNLHIHYPWEHSINAAHRSFSSKTGF